MKIHPPDKIYIAQTTDTGRGVFAAQDIKKGEIIEHAPIIPLNEKDTQYVQSQSDTLIYYFLEQLKLDRTCILLGYASLYNHSATPNADLEYEVDPNQMHVYFVALKNIKKDEEILWNYDLGNEDEIKFMPKGGGMKL